MTLKELSSKSGLSISFLSQVERGNNSLAITSLQKISEALNVPITTFFENADNHQYFTKASERKNIRFEGSNVVFSRLGGDFAGRALEPMYITLSPMQKQGIAFNHPGEEFYYVLEGTVIFTVDNQEYQLSAGDSIHFPSTIDHTWYNPTDQETKILCVLTPVIFKN